MARVVRCAARDASCVVGAFVTLALLAAPPARAFEEYETEIPNVVAAGGPGCDALCHNTGGTSSPLYENFETAGFVWNATMANLDADGDGFSNGWELQDPAGTWPGGTSHPGSTALVSNPAASASRPILPFEIAPATIVHTEAAGQDLFEEFELRNVGAVPFDYSLAPIDSWMTPDPSGAAGLPAAQFDVITLFFVTAGLIPGLYEGDLVLSIPGIRDDRIPTIPVDLTVTVPEPSAILATGTALLSLALLARRWTSASSLARRLGVSRASLHRL